MRGPALAHPRSRGENQMKAQLVCRRHWLIPAHAGKTQGEENYAPTYTGSSPLTRGKRRPQCRAPWRCPAHPRSRGENPDLRPRVLPRAGSSPLTRGKQASALRMRETARLIPAHAGKTSGPLARPRNRRGSSPLTRGKHCDGVPQGQSGLAHPRSRGENQHVRQSAERRL